VGDPLPPLTLQNKTRGDGEEIGEAPPAGRWRSDG